MISVKQSHHAGGRQDLGHFTHESAEPMKIAGLNERLARVFRIVEFDDLMSVHDTPEAAIAEFSASAAS